MVDEVTQVMPDAGKPAKKPIFKKWWFWAIVVVVAIAAFGGSGNESAKPSGSSEVASAPASGETEAPAEEAVVEVAPEEAAPAAAKIGDAVQVGDFVFTVESAKPTTKLSNILGSVDGSWLMVTIKVENKGSEALMVNGSSFKIVDAAGAKYETDSDNLMYVDSKELLIFEKINPNMSKSGTLIFAVPANIESPQLEVSSDLFGLETGLINLK